MKFRSEIAAVILQCELSHTAKFFSFNALQSIEETKKKKRKKNKAIK